MSELDDLLVSRNFWRSAALRAEEECTKLEKVVKAAKEHHWPAPAWHDCVLCEALRNL